MSSFISIQVTREMKIENEAAGSVIGKGGSKVGEIRKISGAQVTKTVTVTSFTLSCSRCNVVLMLLLRLYIRLQRILTCVSDIFLGIIGMLRG